jgi:UDP-glucose 4-epimerase
MAGRALNNIVVTGANGFVGEALCALLTQRGLTVRRAVRTARTAGDTALGDFGANTDWAPILHGAGAVLHLAARTHVLHDTAADPEAAYRAINVEATQRLALCAVAAGVPHVVFLSSIKVNGEATHGTPYSEASPPRPLDAYGRTKLEAERALAEITQGTNTSFTLLRSPLVYGPGVKANFLRLLHFAARGVPLPLAAIDNRRSLIYAGNLAHALLACVENPAARGQTFLVCDDEQPSTPELIRRMGDALGARPRLFALPQSLLRAIATLAGRGEEWRRLAGSLAIDASTIRATLGWTPPYTMGQGLADTARWYHREFPTKSRR